MNQLSRYVNREVGLNYGTRGGQHLRARSTFPQENWPAGFVAPLARGTEFLGSWDAEDCNSLRTGTGSIFGVEFSLDGKCVVGCCSNKAWVLLDAHNRKCMFHNADAHTNCINGATFIDDNLFATGSDDFTIKIWDMRRHEKPTAVVEGFSNWVKSVHKYGDYVIGGSFGEVCAYHVKRDETSTLYQVPQSMLTQLCVAPETNKLIMSTTAGCIMVIHDLDIETIREDLGEFLPCEFAAAQRRLNAPRPSHTAFSLLHLFDRSRRHNRVEIINDFAMGTHGRQPDFITSVTVHPEELCILSRNIVHRGTECLSVHDITDSNPPSQGDSDTICYVRYEKDESSDESESSDMDDDSSDDSSSDDDDDTVLTFTYPFGGSGRGRQQRHNCLSPEVEEEVKRLVESQHPGEHCTVYVFEESRPWGAAGKANGTGNHENGTDTLGNGNGNHGNANHGSFNGNHGNSNRNYSDGSHGRGGYMHNNNNGSGNHGNNDAGNGNYGNNNGGDGPVSRPIVKRVPKASRRLIYNGEHWSSMPYIQYIKEPAFGMGGRIIVTPRDDGIQLLGFDEKASHLRSLGVGESPKQLQLLHSRPLSAGDGAMISAARYSPVGDLLVASTFGRPINGDLQKVGSINFYQPRL